MYNLIYTEFLKLKRTKMLWLVLIGALMPVFMKFFFVQVGNLDWREFFNSNLLFFHVMMGPPLLALLSGFVVAREYSDRTINQLFVYPHRRISILTGKLIVIFLMLLAISAINFLLMLLSGTLLGAQAIPGDLLVLYFKVYVWMFVFQALLVPMTMTAGMIGKSYIPPVVLGIVALLVNSIALSGFEDDAAQRVNFGSFLPFGSMIVHMMGMITDAPVEHSIHALYPHGAVFLIFFTFNWLYYTRSEVHSGS